MTMMDIGAKVDEDEVAAKLPVECIVDQVKKRNLVAEIVAAADDSALLAELHERDLDVEALVKDHDAAELVRLVRRWQPELVTIDDAKAGELLDLLAYAGSALTDAAESRRAARAAYDLLRDSDPNVDTIESRMRLVAQWGTPAQLL